MSAVAAGSSHSLALKNDGTLWAWGFNWDGSVGDGTTTSRSLAVQVCSAYNGTNCTAYLSGVSAISAGSSNSFALMDDGTLWAWGVNLDSQLGDGTRTPRYLPAPVQLVQVIEGK